MKIKLIPDSSFFICFFDDLEGLMEESERLGFISLVTREYLVEIPEYVHLEAGFEDRNYDFSDSISVISIDDFASGGLPFEPLRMIVDRGEFEVIVLSYRNKKDGTENFIFILDDGSARKKVREFLPLLIDNLKGTIGFLAHLEENNYLSSEITINILNCIGKSKFRINKKMLESVIKDINRRGEGYERY